LKREIPRRNVLYNLISASLLAALTAALTMLHVPVGPGFVHLGDVFVILAGCLLPMPYAMAAGAIGGGMADWMLSQTIWIPATLLVKAAVAALFSAKRDKILCARNVLALLPAAVVTVGGYGIATALLYSWEAALVESLGNLVQAAGSAAAFCILAGAMDRAGLKGKLTKWGR